MLKIQLITSLLLHILLYAASDTARAQGTSIAFQKQRRETIPLAKALKKVSDLFDTQFVYEKSLLEGKTTVYNEAAMKGKPVEEVLKGILYPNGLVFLYVKENYYSIVAKDMLYENRGQPKEVAINQFSDNTKGPYISAKRRSHLETEPELLIRGS